MDETNLEFVMANQYGHSKKLEHYCNYRLPKKPGIYKISFPNDKFYIGKSVNMFQRQMSHLRELRNGKHTNPIIQRIYNKHTHYSFNWSVLLICDKSELKQNEQMAINLYWFDDGLINIRSESQSIPNKPKEWKKSFVFMNCWTMQPVWFSTRREAQRTLGWSSDKTRHANYQRHEIDYVFTDTIEAARDYCIKRQSKFISSGVVWNGVWYASVSEAHKAAGIKMSLGYFRRLLKNHSISSHDEHKAWLATKRNSRFVMFNGKAYLTFEQAYMENNIDFLSLDHFRKYVKKYGCETTEHLKLCSVEKNGCPIGQEHLYKEWQDKRSEYRPSCYLVAHVNGRWYPNLNEAKEAIYNTYKNED